MNSRAKKMYKENESFRLKMCKYANKYNLKKILELYPDGLNMKFVKIVGRIILIQLNVEDLRNIVVGLNALEIGTEKNIINMYLDLIRENFIMKLVKSHIENIMKKIGR